MYYKVVVKFGHQGMGKYVDGAIYVEAEDLIKAIDVARAFPAVKHTKLPLEAREISKEEFEIGRQKNVYEMFKSGEMNDEKSNNIY